MTGLPAAVLWDFDGTLVDTEPLWAVTERRLAEELGGTLPADFSERTVGGQAIDTALAILDATGSDADPHDIVDRLWASMRETLAHLPIPWLPGVESLVAALADEGVPQAVVSSSAREYLQVILGRLDPLAFSVVVGGDDVRNGKPDPEPYLLAARLLGVDPADCLVVEDSIPGTASGLAAGAAVLAVPQTHTIAEGPRLSVVGSLADADLSLLRDAASKGAR